MMAESGFRTRKARVVKKTETVRPHMSHRGEKTFRVKGHKAHVEEIKYGGDFNQVAESIAKDYEGKVNPKTGKKYTKSERMAIGKGTAARIYREKLAKTKRGL